MADIEGAQPGARLDAVDLGAADPPGAQVDPAGGPYLSIDVLRTISASITMLDSWKATERSDGDKRKAGMLAYLFTAQRIGAIAPSSGDDQLDLELFLASVRQDDFVQVAAPASREGKSTAS